jgi:hypothetical protein
MTRSLCLAAAVGVTAAAIGGCGGGSGDGAAVRDTLARLGEATAAHDYHALCTRILAPALVQSVAATGLSCEVALKTGLGAVKEPRLEVSNVAVKGSEATAQVRTSARGQQAADDVVRLVKVRGGWRVSSLSGGAGGASSGK